MMVDTMDNYCYGNSWVYKLWDANLNFKTMVKTHPQVALFDLLGNHSEYFFGGKR
jgi:hypothetical protein